MSTKISSTESHGVARTTYDQRIRMDDQRRRDRIERQQDKLTAQARIQERENITNRRLDKTV